MNTHNVKTAALESSERYGEGQHPYTINMAEGEKGTDYADFECYAFGSLKELQKFRKSFPEKMRNQCYYQLSTCAISNGRYKNIDIVSADHYKQFIKQVKASGVSI
ncbi:hypothetical protein [Serratia sp. N21D137]|uniref:hypothetical protein n=1 Tax=Serratia sp. N21D137 TaxID=3397495 RepID=UPI0039E1FC3B